MQVLSGKHDKSAIIEIVTTGAVIKNGDTPECLLCVKIRNSRTKFFKEPPHRRNIIRGLNQFEETVCLWKRKSRERPTVKNEVVKTFVKCLYESHKINVSCQCRTECLSIITAVRVTQTSVIESFRFS